MTKFRTILLGIFGLFILGGVLVFALSRGSSTTQAHVTIWGTFPQTTFNQFSNDAGLTQSKTLSITYVEVDPTSLDANFTEALAEGKGPDIIILPQDKLWEERNKLIPIPYVNVTQADFTSSFIDEGSLFLSSAGVYAVPLYVDPMVLYSNKDILASAGFAKPLSYWDEIYDAATKLTFKDSAGNITQSIIALGTTSNIPHAKDILSLLMLEAGTPITDLSSGGLTSKISSSEGLPTVPGDAAVDFYTQFSNPEKTFYSWNRALLPAQTDFISGNAAYYLGYASEYPILKAKNPTLSLGVSSVPQSRVGGKSITYGKLYGMAVSKGSTNQSAALSAILTLVSSANVGFLVKNLGLPPARRDLLSVKQNDPAEAVFYASAIKSAGWLDPDDVRTQSVFTTLLDSVTSGRSATETAIQDADSQLTAVINSTP